MTAGPNRAVITVAGADNTSFLNRLLTINVPDPGQPEITCGALLTPRGTIVADLLIQRSGDDIVLDTHADNVSDLCARLNAYRLRADVRITMQTQNTVALGTQSGNSDPRHPDLPDRQIIADSSVVASIPMETYHRVRIASIIPECVADYGPDSVYPADVNLDLIGGVDFTKGCFIGQEVVSRMKRRGTSRRRTVLLHCSDLAPDPGTGVMAGTTRLGEITSCCGSLALARLRIDRLAEARTDQVQTGQTTATVTLPGTEP